MSTLEKEHPFILAGLFAKGERSSLPMRQAECERLMEAAGLCVCATMFQFADRIDAGMVFRSGKLAELKNLIEATHPEGILFLHEIPVTAAENLAHHFELPVLDRTSLILMIFSERARTRQAKLQVEAARLAYAMPGLSERYEDQDTHSRGGGFQNRGAGERRSALIRRQNRKRIREIQKELMQIEAREKIAEARRSKTRMKTVALVGYTNAGKSSLLNGMIAQYGSGKPVSVEDRLFETMDASVRRIDVDGHSYYLYDTVGFVSDLPHGLVEAFKSTLSGALHADLLIHVIDGNDPEWSQKAAVTEEALHQIGADQREILRVFTKADLGSIGFEALNISTKDPEGIECFAQAVNQKLYGDELAMTCVIPYDKMAMIDFYRDALKMIGGAYSEEGQVWTVFGDAAALKPFRIYEQKEGK